MQAAAEHYPDRVVRIVNPFPPGGSVDITARMLAQKLTRHSGPAIHRREPRRRRRQYRRRIVAKSEPDGYTLLFTAPGPLIVNQTLYTKGSRSTRPRISLPIAIFASTPIVLMVNPDVPAKNVQELIAYAKRIRARSISARPARHDPASLGRAVQEP